MFISSMVDRNDKGPKHKILFSEILTENKSVRIYTSMRDLRRKLAGS